MDIKKFNIDNINGKKFLFIGDRLCGKTTLIQDFVSNHSQEFDAGIVFSQNEPKFNNIQDIYYHKYNNENDQINISKVLENLISRQIALKDINKISKVFVYFDFFMKSLVEDKNIKWLLNNCRCIHTTLIFETDYIDTFPVELRSQFDYIFISKISNNESILKAYNNFAGFFESFNLFQEVYNKCKVNYGSIVLENHYNHIIPLYYSYSVDIVNN